VGDAAKFNGSAKTNWEVVTKLPIQVQNFDSIESIKNEVLVCDIIVDTVFGTGLTRDVEGKYKEAIHLINQSGKPAFSVDIPSGISGDTGQILGAAVRRVI